jgi:tetratricopeptide (TPR) repeat protein
MDARFDDAQAITGEALAVGSHLGSETVMQMYGVQTLAIARARGGLEPLLPIIQSLVEQFPLVPAWRCGMALLYRDLGMLDEAREQLELFASDDFRALPRDANWKVGVGILAAVCAMVGDVDRAERLYELLLPVADTMLIAGMPADVLGSVHGPLALLAATLGRWDDAERHYEAAQAANERCGSRAWVVHTRFEWARVVARRDTDGDQRAARALLEACREDATALGMPLVVEGCDGLLETLGR